MKNQVPEFLRQFIRYNGDAMQKKAFMNGGITFYHRLMKAMGFARKDYEIRMCPGGPAVLGKVICHTDHFYLQIHGNCFGRGVELLYRECRNRADYTGGRNNYVNMVKVAMPGGFDKLIAVLNKAQGLN